MAHNQLHLSPHPLSSNYHSEVAPFMHRDSSKNMRIIRLMQIIRELKIPKVLYVIHSMGGGTFQHVQEIIEASKGKFFPLILKPEINSNFFSLKFDIEDDLSDKSGVGISTIKRLEVMNGVPAINISTMVAIQKALENAGVEFIGSPDDGPGVRLK
jgi:hypothetical protein